MAPAGTGAGGRPRPVAPGAGAAAPGAGRRRHPDRAVAGGRRAGGRARAPGAGPTAAGPACDEPLRRGRAGPGAGGRLAVAAGGAASPARLDPARRRARRPRLASCSARPAVAAGAADAGHGRRGRRRPSSPPSTAHSATARSGDGHALLVATGELAGWSIDRRSIVPEGRRRHRPAGHDHGGVAAGAAVVSGGVLAAGACRRPAAPSRSWPGRWPRWPCSPSPPCGGGESGRCGAAGSVAQLGISEALPCVILATSILSQHKEVRTCQSPSSPELSKGLGRALAQRAGRAGVVARGRRPRRRRPGRRRRRSRPGAASPSPATSPTRPTGPPWSPPPSASAASTCSSTTPAPSAPARSPGSTASPLDTFRRTLEVNVVAPLALVQAALPLLRAGGGRVVNITSDAGVEGYETWGGYGSSKAALEQLSNVLAAEEPGVRVYWVDPGDMRTEMHQDAFPGEDISDRPPPDESVPGLLALIEGDQPSGRYARPGAGGADEPRPRSTGPGAATSSCPPSWRPTSRPRRRGVRRDDVRLLVSTGCDEPVHARFHDLARFLQPGDLVVVNTSGTRAAAIDAVAAGRRPPRRARVDRAARRPVAGRGPPARCPAAAPTPFDGDLAGATLTLAGGGAGPPARPLHRLHPAVGGHPRRCHAGWRPTWSATAGPSATATSGGTGRCRPTRPSTPPTPGSAEMPSAGRPFTPEVITALVARGVGVTPLLLAHRRVVARRPRAAVPGALPGAGRDGRAGERHPRRRAPRRRRRHHRRAGAGDGHRRRRPGPSRRGLDRARRSRPSGACGPSTGWSPAGTSRRRRTC